ncbi:MAG: aspartate carbamoyltransferase [Nitrososphaerales archaeon]
MSLKGRDVISIKDFSRDELDLIFKVADEMEQYTNKTLPILSDKIVAMLFFEPSTRTRLSFETSVLRLGGKCIGFSEPSISSIAKGETLADTIRMVDGYADLIVIRHPLDGAARYAAEIAESPIINGGDGSTHHPTQAMLDLYTIRKKFGGIDGLHIAIMGDLAHARASASFAYGLSKYNVKLTLISPPQLRMRREVVDYLKEKLPNVNEIERLSDVIKDVDVIYITRVQKERFANLEEYEKIKDLYRLDCEAVKNAKESMVILHPLPRVTELSPELDNTPHALYFQQARNGIPVRMALISLIMGVK